MPECTVPTPQLRHQCNLIEMFTGPFWKHAPKDLGKDERAAQVAASLRYITPWAQFFRSGSFRLVFRSTKGLAVCNTSCKPAANLLCVLCDSHATSISPDVLCFRYFHTKLSDNFVACHRFIDALVTI